MGKLRGFKEIEKLVEPVIDPKKRIQNYNEFTLAPDDTQLQDQGARCMDCM